MRAVNCTIRANNAPVPKGTPIEAWINNDDINPILYDGAVEEDGRLIFHLPDGRPVGGATISVNLEGYKLWTGRVILPLDNATEGPEINLELEPSKIVPIHIEGMRFMDPSGNPWLWKGATDFLLFKKYLDGEDILAILEQRVAAGANLVRVLGMCHNITHFYPQDYPDYYDKLVGFVELLAYYGLYVEFVIFADQQYVKVAEQAHYIDVCARLRGKPNVFVELCNEYEKNGIDPKHFTKPAGIIASAGSGLSDRPPGYFWDFFGWHGRRDWPKLPFVDDMLIFMKRMNIPAIHDEPIGADETDQPARRTTSTLAMRSVASEAARLGCGGTYHSEAGLRSELWGPVQARLAPVFYGAMV